jgi:hypothetical protein
VRRPRLLYLLAGALAIVLVVTRSSVTLAAQMPDRSFRPMIEDRAYAIGAGPVVCFDEGHRNAQALGDGFWPFGDLVRRDGYVVRPVRTLDRESLSGCQVVVIASPRSPLEAAELPRWVRDGGSLLLLLDQDSLPAASALAAAFGVEFTNTPAAPTTFRSGAKTLRPHAIARGRHAKESAANVTTFAGVAMRVPSAAEPLLVAPDGAVQGLVMRVEMGRAAFFSDPALFTAQIVGPERRLVGMSAPGAEQNFRFVLNVMHWLSGVI